MELRVDEENTVSYESIVKVVGVGGAGNNAVNHMYDTKVFGIDYVICNTDMQDLENSPVAYRIQLGEKLTEGLGAGSIPAFGKDAAEESEKELKEMLGGNTRMVILAAGMGGGTGTGATPVVARIAKELGLVVVAIVTTPFGFERKRIKEALQGIEELREYADSLLIINNQKLQQIYGDLSFPEACEKANDVLVMAARSISEICTKTSSQNIDYSDLERVLRGSGMAVFGVGRAKGVENRVVDAIKEAMYSPLLDNCDIMGARNLLVNIVVSDEKDFTVAERECVGPIMKQLAGEYNYLKHGFREDKDLEQGELVVTVVATNFTPEEEVKNILEPEKVLEDQGRPEIEMIIEDPSKVKEEKIVRRKQREEQKQHERENADKVEEMKQRYVGKKRKENSSILQGIIDFVTAKDAEDIEMK